MIIRMYGIKSNTSNTNDTSINSGNNTRINGIKSNTSNKHVNNKDTNDN